MKSVSRSILIIDDDPVSVERIRASLDSIGYRRIEVAMNGTDGLAEIRTHPHSMVLLDLVLPDISGQDILRATTREFPGLPVVVLTASDRVEDAVECMKIGAFDFLTKPPDTTRLRNAIEHAMRVRDLEERLTLFSGKTNDQNAPRRPELFREIVTRSPKMHAVFAYVEAIADSPRAVLISGESGTGKELIARSIHTASGRTGECVTVNVAGTDDTMFTDTMFGHVRGAFTGADRARDGLVERARGGTLFLDEIGDLDVTSQTKLLRLLQEGEYYPLGSDEPRTADVRVLAATNADLAEKQRTGSFRADLYYRLVSHHVRIPPLRERREDIPLLVEHFLGDTVAIEPDASTLLDRYPFPGNVRELQAIISDAVSRSSGSTITAETIRAYLGSTIERRRELTDTDERFTWSGPFPTIEEITEYLIDRALSETGGNQSAAARLLGVSQSTLSRRTRRDSG